jgi:hypothetical protein
MFDADEDVANGVDRGVVFLCAVERVGSGVAAERVMPKLPLSESLPPLPTIRLFAAPPVMVSLPGQKKGGQKKGILLLL